MSKLDFSMAEFRAALAKKVAEKKAPDDKKEAVLAAMKEFRSAQTDEDALEAFEALKNLMAD
jgi:hypothetical protein